MKQKDAAAVAEMVEALRRLPKVRRALADKAPRDAYYESVHLEMSAAEMEGRESGGATHYFYLPPPIGREVLDAVKNIVRDELRKLGVTLRKKA